MRLAVYNVENLFTRAKAMNQGTWAQGQKVLKEYADLNKLLGQVKYTEAAKKKMVALMKSLGLAKSDEGPFVLLRQNRGDLVKRPRVGGMEIVARGRADWVGSLELKRETVDELAMRNTARVIIDVEPDILGIVEAESRPALGLFVEDVVGAIGDNPFRHVMLIDGNDTRGIDVGLITRSGFPIGPMRSHVDDLLPSGENVFSRDCPEFTVTTPSGNEIIVMVNHFKSKGYGSQESSNNRRRAQAERVQEIYKQRIAAGNELITVVGDLNDTPSSAQLKPLVDGTSLKDVFEHPQFDNGGYPGTFGNSSAANKIDYIFLSPKLFAKVTQGGAWRMGMWPGVRPVKWPAYSDMTEPHHAASDHAAVWVDIDI
jgi:endonuclease/exonuclease/phosphatase family metal-dependent hydrolase